MHPKKSSLVIFLLIIAMLFFLSPKTKAGLGDDILADSLISLAPGEPTLQQLLDSLGYNIDVANDELGWESFCSAPGSNVSMILVEVAASATSAASGWYNAADSSEKYELFTPGDTPGDSAVFVIENADSIGFYMTPNLISYESWYTQQANNNDAFDHALIFPTGNPHEYIIAFEDLKDGGDGDFNDLVFRVRFENAPPVLSLPDDMNFNVCYENYVCFDVGAWDANCLGDTVTLEMLEGYGDFTTLTSPGEVSTELCFLPGAADATYSFVFKATDNSGAYVIDSFKVVYEINDRPSFSLPGDFDTLICDYDSICIPFNLVDADGDYVEIEFLEGNGSIDYNNETFCFLPDKVDSAAYTFILKASDSCCLAKEEANPDFCCPPPCPEDTITIGVKVNLTPTLVTVPDFDTLICEPQEICFPVSASDLNVGDNVTIAVSSPAYYDAQTGEVCFMADASGNYTIAVTATDELCGAQAIDTVNINVELNSPPELVVANDSSYYFCSEPTEICFDNTVLDDDGLGGNVFSLLAGLGSIDPQTGTVCFTPPGEGDYEFVIQVTDTCQNTDVDTVNLSVQLNSPPILTLPDDFAVQQCSFEPICFQAEAADPDLPDDQLTFIKVSGFGSINSQTGELCFTPVMAGNYQFVIRVRDLCGQLDQDTIYVNVGMNTPPTIIADPVYNAFFCNTGDSACIELMANDPDAGEVLTFEQISGQAGTLNAETGEFCFELSGAGDYNFTFRVVDHCGQADTADVTVTAQLNQAPIVNVPDDFADTVCTSESEVCFNVGLEDSEGQNLDITVLPFGTYDNGVVCFPAVASQDTTFCIVVKATDVCGASAEDTVCVDVHYNQAPTVDIFPDTTIDVCDSPEDFCFSYVANDPDSPAPTISIVQGSGTVQNGQICINIDTVGIYCVAIRATDDCGAYDEDDACVVFVGNLPPQIAVSDNITTTLCEPSQICFDNSATDPNLPDDTLEFSITSGPAGATIDSNGRVCFTPEGAGQYNFTIRVTDNCGDYDEGLVSVDVDLDEAPQITASPDSLSYEYCGFGAAVVELCFNGLTISDPDDDVSTLTVEKIAGPGTFDPATMMTCFDAPVADDVIDFVYRVTDTCGAYGLDTVQFYISVNPNCDSATCLEVSIENTECVVTNSYVEVSVSANVEVAIGGFDMVIKYDPTAFTLIDVYRGDATQDWEYFTYREGDIGGCTGVCPDGLIRIVAIADRNDGIPHPPEEAYYPNGDIARMKFYVTPDLNFSGMTYAVDFYWVKCSDNAFSSRTGDTLFVEKMITGQYGLIWDEFDDDNFPEDGRYPGIGVPDSCLIGDKTHPQRCVILNGGSICIISSDEIDKRGDLNLNEIAYEIADAVLFTNYFIYGPSVFTLNYDGQIAASDVNGDGRTLTVGDLIYLIRVLIGDAQPIPKLSPFAQDVDLTLARRPGEIQMRTNSTSNIGIAYMMFDVSGAESIPQIVKSDKIGNMELKYNVDGDTMRVLVYSMERDRIEAGENLLGTIQVDGDIKLISSDMADYYGSDLAVNVLEKNALPSNYELSQNFPNPFNPETEIQLSLPEASDWKIDIINIKGQIVQTFSGYSDAGVVTVKFKADNLASGMYFYRAVAGEFKDTKKMVLLK
jgi:hypothetical protein